MVGESETHFVETNRRSRCVALIDSILSQYFITSCYFPTKSYMLPLLNETPNLPTAMQLFGMELKFSASSSTKSIWARQQSWKLINSYPRWLPNFSGSIHRQSTAKTLIKWHWGRHCSRLYAVWLMTGWPVLTGLQLFSTGCKAW